jgi:hypothetical protein
MEGCLVRKGLLGRALRLFLKLLGFGFLTGAFIGTRVMWGERAEEARSEVARELRSLADRLEEDHLDDGPAEEE